MMLIEKTPATVLAALLLGAILAFGAPTAKAFAAEGEVQVAANYDARRNLELQDQRVPLESVIAQISRTCPGQLINARHDARTNMYIVRWETSDHRIVSIRADAATGRILSTGGC
jgi:uncharacterized membrane protein YkoI